ncbi:MAG: putative toxin-antitoxin system toxin component, PIN family [Betaproteobacteria bacterium]|nr:putative toxin-antitoxin system toxin component, PIN family [Betaproteobacteria bacterium]
MQIVLDTNVVLDWLVFRDPGIAHIVTALERRLAVVVTNDLCEAELARVLAYDTLALNPSARQSVLDTYRQTVTRNPYQASALPLPRCKDPDDQKFLELARDAGAQYLVTKDKALLKLVRARYRLRGFSIVLPRGFPAPIAS